MFCPSLFFCYLGADISSPMHGDHERWTKLVHSPKDCARICNRLRNRIQGIDRSACVCGLAESISRMAKLQHPLMKKGYPAAATRRTAKLSYASDTAAILEK
jgi:hypothetical protein